MILNEGGEIPKCKSADGKHKLIITKRPDGNRSGWHEERCEICGQEISYDDSD